MPETTVHCGLWHHGLEPQLIFDIESAKQRDPLGLIVVLVGSRLLADYFTWHFNSLSINCFNLHFVTVAGLARELSLGDRISDDRLPLPNGAGVVALSALFDTLDPGNYFKGVASRQGIVNSLAGSFHDLDLAGIGGLDKLDSAFGQSDKFEALSTLRREYLRTVSGFRLPTDDLSVKDSGDKFISRYGTDLLHIYGLYDFPELQKQFIRGIAKSVSLKVYFPYSERGGAFRYTDSGLQFFSSLPSSQIINPDKKNDSLSYGQLLFQHSIETDKSVTSVPKLTMLSGKDKRDEIVGIVARISEMVLYDDVHPESIGIMLWQPADYLQPLRDELDRARVPYADMIGSTLSDTKEGRAAARLIGLVGGKLKRMDVVDLLASDDLTVGDGCDPVMWEKISVDSGVVEAGRNGWISAFQIVEETYEYRLSDKPELLGRLAEQMDKFCQFILGLFDSFELIPRKGKWSELTAPLTNLIEAFIPPSDTTDQIINVISELSGLDEVTEIIDQQSFIDSALNALESVKIERGRYQVNGVTICDKMTARGIRFDLLFIPGMVQGAIPVIPREDPILNDSERMKLNRMLGSDLLTPKLTRIEEEKLLFATAVDSARERLFLTYPESKIGGGTLRVSRFLLEMCRIAAGKPLTVEQMREQPFFERATDSGIDFRKRLTSPDDYIDSWINSNVPLSSQVQAYGEIYKTSHAFNNSVRAITSRKSGVTFTAWDGMIGSEPRLSADMTHSASSLQLYASCPFRYLVQRVFHADEWEEPEELLEPAPQDVGTVIHKILQKMYVNAHLDEIDRSDGLNWYLTELDRIIESQSGWIEQKLKVPASICAMEGEFIRNRLRRFIQQEFERDDGFMFETAEMSIDRKIELGGDNAPIHLKGKIDRIDFSSDRSRMRVIDYKTGKSKPTFPEKFIGGTNIQIPLYLSAIMPLHKGIELENIEGLFRWIDRRGNSSELILSGSDLIAREAELYEVLRVISSGIVTGQFPPIPVKSDICARCDAASVCDYRSRNAAEYRVDDPRVAELISAREVL